MRDRSGSIRNLRSASRLPAAAPQVLGPAISAPIVTHLGGYPALFALTAVVTLAGAVAVVKIRSVR